MFTDSAWTSLLLGAGVRLSYVLHGSGDNPEVESVFCRVKVENRFPITQYRISGETQDHSREADQITQTRAPSLLSRRPAA